MMTKDDNQPSNWTEGLPSNEELTSLSHMLVSPLLASAFRIRRDEPMTGEDVHRESQATLHKLFKQNPTPVFDAFPAYQEREDEGGYGYGMESRSTAADLRGKRRVEEEFRGNRVKEGFREEFRGNQRVEEDFREEFGGNRRMEERRHDSRFRAVEDRMDHLGALRADIPKAPCSSANDTTGPTKGDVRSNVGVGGAGVQGLQTNTTSNTATNTPREYPSTPVGHKRPDLNTHKHRNESPGQPSSPYLSNALPYGPYQPGRPESSYGGGREGESSGGRESTENGCFELEDANSAGEAMNSNDDANTSALKRARLVWTPQLHKRFVETIGHLGMKNAAPKTIMQLMNVEGLTRENVASHLQKYRLYLKHMQGLSTDSPSVSDHLNASTPIPPSIMPLGVIPWTGTSPHFMASSGSQQHDGGGPFTTPIIPMQLRGLVRPGPFRGYEHMPYSSMAGGYMEQSAMPERQEFVPENGSHSRDSHTRNSFHSNQPGSSSQHVLPLFPTN